LLMALLIVHERSSSDSSFVIFVFPFILM
jgi:hypothetical protein